MKTLETLELRSEDDVDVDDAEADTTINDDVMKSEITQTISATSFSVDDKSSDSIVTSSSDSDDSSSSGGDNIRHQEIPSQVTSHLDNDDSSRRLISDESSNQLDDNVDDLPVTTDLTLTKTVELTENEPDPEPEVNNVVDEPESEPITYNAIEPEIPQPLVMEMMRHQVDEPNDVKEMSCNNFESTMDDISDAELESLEQELDDLVATAEKSSCESAVRALEAIMDRPEEINETLPVVMTVAFPEVMPPAEPVLSPVTPVDTVVEPTIIEDFSEIQEISVVSENVDEQRESSVSEAQEAIEPPNSEHQETPADPDAALSTSSTDESTSIQNLPSQSNEDFSINESNSTGSLTSAPDLGRVPPYWIPDNMTNQCMQCDLKFSLIKRRHHCRACGLLLCSSCCSEKFFLHYLGSEGRICASCFETLVKNQQQQQNQPRNPNPANPMEYCSTLPPQQQVPAGSTLPPSVMVPSGVLKRGPRSTERKSVIFSDGIRPGTDLDETPTGTTPSRAVPDKPPKFNMPTINEKTNSFIPETANELPPVLQKESEFKYVDNNLPLLQRLRQEELKFAINKNFYVTVKIVTRKFAQTNRLWNFIDDDSSF